MRRDPSDIIKVGELYYVWYSKGPQASGYDATVWYATSPDGHQSTEQGIAIRKGEKGSWDEHGVFTPNILISNDRYWLFYTAVPELYINQGSNTTKTAIGMAVSSSPDGPWEKLASNPVLKTSDSHEDFDSLRIDDACLIVRDGKYWMYYKGPYGKKTQTIVWPAILLFDWQVPLREFGRKGSCEMVRKACWCDARSLCAGKNTYLEPSYVRVPKCTREKKIAA
jgi:sucrose-6-phosphate hydrolase SacC (GH32 family)